MDWIRSRRAYLIGGGAMVVALVALGVVLHSDRSSLPRRMYVVNGHGPFLRALPLAPGRGGPDQFARPMPGLRGPEPRFAVPLPLHEKGRLLRGYAAAVGVGVLHGTYTVAGPRGGYRTIEIQRGKVTKLTADSITVRSTDGFTATYLLGNEPAHAKVGDGVQLRATVEGKDNKATVTELFRAPVRTK